MAKLRDLTEMPPMARGSAEEQLAELRDYLIRVIEELEYVLTHIEADNVNNTLFERIYQMIPRAYTGLPLTDGTASAGTQNAWSRGDHRHGTDTSRAAAADLTTHVEDNTNPHEVTKAQVGLGNVDNVLQYSVSNPPPIPTPAQVGAIPSTEKGAAGGVAELDANGMVPSAQLPSYVDDVLEYASLSAFPATGETGKIYVALDTNKTYRWSGSAYVEISESLALGETSSTAYRGDRGKTAYDHSQTTGNPHGTTAADVGLGNVANERQYSALNPPPLPTPADIGAATAQDLTDHVGDTSNPHSVTAAQVGARPDTWMPTASDVGARADTWMPTAADVGARPDTWTPTKADIGLGNVEDERQYSASNPPPVPDAEDIPYDNTQSGLSATDLQAAVDELAQGGGGGGPSPSVSNPAMDGIADPGVSLLYAREDHIHPSDTSKADVSSVPTQPSDIGAQEEILASGILKGDGAGGVSAAVEGTDYGTYSKPSGGIPETDLAFGVQTSLGLADTAYQKPSGGIPASDLASGVIPTVPSASATNPAMDGTASPGSSGAWARGDHVHPSDTSRIPTSAKGVANGVATLDATGKVPYSQLPATSTPDAADVSFDPSTSGIVSDNVQDAIDEVVAGVLQVEGEIPEPYTSNPAMDGTASPGSATTWAKGDHVHPTDTSRVPTTRTVNGKALSADISLDYTDVGAEPVDSTILKNRAGNATSLSIMGGATPAAAGNMVAVGPDAWTGNSGDIAIGKSSSATGTTSMAIGFQAKVTGANAIQLGAGTNADANTVKVGYRTLGTNYELLDSSGIIPPGRMPVDTEPTLSSDNLLTSGVIYDTLVQMDSDIRTDLSDAISARYSSTTIYNTLTDVHTDTTITMDHSFTNYKFLMVVFNTRSPASSGYRIPLVVSTNALPQGGFYAIANPDAQGYVRLNYVSGQAKQLRVQSTNFSALYIASVSGLT